MEIITLHEVDNYPASHHPMKLIAEDIIREAIYPKRPSNEMNEVLNDQEIYIALLPNGEPIGSAATRMVDEGETVIIENLAVSQSVRGRGFGKEILKLIEQRALSGGASQAELIPTDGVPTFYKNQGYTTGFFGEVYKKLSNSGQLSS